MSLKLHGAPTIDPGRKVWVLLHKDETHVASLPNGEADWSYERSHMELRLSILKKDFKNNFYGVVELHEAVRRIANKQGELAVMWAPVLKEIRRASTLEHAFNLYEAAQKKLGAHPVEADAWLRKKLQLD